MEVTYPLPIDPRREAHLRNQIKSACANCTLVNICGIVITERKIEGKDHIVVSGAFVKSNACEIPTSPMDN